LERKAGEVAKNGMIVASKKKRANDPNGFFHHIGSWDSPANLGESRWVLLNKWG
jgi:hypothetical protein